MRNHITGSCSTTLRCFLRTLRRREKEGHEVSRRVSIVLIISLLPCLAFFTSSIMIYEGCFSIAFFV